MGVEGHKRGLWVTGARPGLRDGSVTGGPSSGVKEEKGGRPQKEEGTWGGLEGLNGSEPEPECPGKWRPAGL